MAHATKTTFARFGLFCLLLAGCGRKEPAAAPSAAAPAAAAAAMPAHDISFIDDDYELARTLASERKLPLFVDVWASWCHTCLSMRSYVFPDPRMRALSDRFVWLAIDSERAGNAAFLERFPARNLPTLWVIDPGSQRALLKWIGAATPQELSEVLEDAAGGSQPSAAGEASALWVRANRASASGEAEQALQLYQQALAKGGAGWNKRPRALEALSMRLYELGKRREIFELALREAPNMPPATALVNVLINGLDAAAELKPEFTGPGLPGLIARATALARDATAPVLFDDRSSLYLSLVEVLKPSQPDESKRLAREWSERLDAEAARARSPAARRVWDPHRVEAYLAIGEAGKALPMLQQSANEVPEDYNPPARLARVYLSLGDLPPAQREIDRALSLSDGPRKLRLYQLKADIAIAAGDRSAARSALSAALKFAEDNRLAPQYDKLRQAIERRLQELS